MQCVPFEIQHLDLLEMREEDRELFKVRPDLLAQIEQANETGYAGSFLHDGRLVFCAGMFPLWDGVLMCWMYSSPYVKMHPVLTVRYAKRYIENIEHTLKAHRTQTITKYDAFHDRWMRALGFVCEGIMRSYTKEGEDFGMYARVKHGYSSIDSSNGDQCRQ